MADQDIKQMVKDKYGQGGAPVSSGEQLVLRLRSACCAATRRRIPITSNLYSESETAALPAEAVAASLGCGNPTALAELAPGETVLDLGSGGGIDVLLSARRVGPTGKAYGLDMTDEMLALARENQRKAGVDNVEFLKGEIEAIPLPDNSVDVIISNCVINLSADKDRVFARRSACSSRADASRSRTSWSAARCRRRSGGASSCGSDAWPARSRRSEYRGQARARPASRPSTSSPRASIAPTMRASSSTAKGSTSPPSRRGGRQVHERVRPGAQAAPGVSRARATRTWPAASPPRRSARRSCSRPSSAPASWASASPAATSRSRCSPTRSRRAPRWSRSS